MASYTQIATEIACETFGLDEKDFEISDNEENLSGKNDKLQSISEIDTKKSDVTKTQSVDTETDDLTENFPKEKIISSESSFEKSDTEKKNTENKTQNSDGKKGSPVPSVSSSIFLLQPPTSPTVNPKFLVEGVFPKIDESSKIEPVTDEIKNLEAEIFNELSENETLAAEKQTKAALILQKWTRGFLVRKSQIGRNVKRQGFSKTNS